MFDDPIDFHVGRPNDTANEGLLYYDDCPMCQVEKQAAIEGRQPTEQEVATALKFIRESRLHPDRRKKHE